MLVSFSNTLENTPVIHGYKLKQTEAKIAYPYLRS